MWWEQYCVFLFYMNLPVSAALTLIRPNGDQAVSGLDRPQGSILSVVLLLIEYFFRTLQAEQRSVLVIACYCSLI